MTDLTREAIVEAAARAQYEHDRATRGGDGPFEWPEWDDLPVFEQAICRQFVFPVVLATLGALEPVAARYVELADINEQVARDGEDTDSHGMTMHRWGASHAYRDAAAILRKTWAL